MEKYTYCFTRCENRDDFKIRSYHRLKNKTIDLQFHRTMFKDTIKCPIIYRFMVPRRFLKHWFQYCINLEYKPDVYPHVFNSSKSFSTIWFGTYKWLFSSVHSKMINKLILSTKTLHISRATPPAAIVCRARITENSIS